MQSKRRPGRPAKPQPVSETGVEKVVKVADTLEEKRKTRRPISGHVKRLEANIPSGFVGRWVNDEVGRVQRFLDAGYRFLSDKEGPQVKDRGSALKLFVGTRRDNEALYSYLMVIEKELYDEDQALKQKTPDAKYQQILGSTPQLDGERHESASSDATYIKTVSVT